MLALYGIPDDYTWLSEKFSPHDYEGDAELLKDNTKAVLKETNLQEFKGLTEWKKNQNCAKFAMVIKVENNQIYPAEIGLSGPVVAKNPNSTLSKKGQFSWSFCNCCKYGHNDGNKVKDFGSLGLSGFITLLCDTERGTLLFLQNRVQVGEVMQNEKLREGGLYLTVVAALIDFSVELINPPCPPCPQVPQRPQQLQQLPYQASALKGRVKSFVSSNEPTMQKLFRSLSMVQSPSSQKFLAELDEMSSEERAKATTVIQAVLANQRGAALHAATLEDAQPQELKPSTERLLYELHQLASRPQLQSSSTFNDATFRKQAEVQADLNLKSICRLSALVMKDDVAEADKSVLRTTLYADLMATLIHIKKEPENLKQLFLVHLKSVLDRVEKHLTHDQREEYFGPAGGNLKDLLPKLKQTLFDSKIAADALRENILKKADEDQILIDLEAEFDQHLQR